jgi:hypothetical protein
MAKSPTNPKSSTPPKPIRKSSSKKADSSKPEVPPTAESKPLDPDAKPKTGSAKSSGKKSGKKAAEEKPAAPAPPAKPEPKVIYDAIDVRLFIADPNRSWTGKPEPLTDEVAKKLVGWKEESDNVKFNKDYRLIDRYGRKIRCTQNARNRPFYPNLAEAWALEVLRRKWEFNGETMIIDKYAFVHDGFHRLIGLILACQDWELDLTRTPAERAERQHPTTGWRDGYWTERPYVETLVALGIEGSDKVVNTIGTGKPRGLGDVLYRSEWFRDLPEKEKRHASMVAKGAVNLIWNRTAQGLVSLAPHRPHSESMEFLEHHPNIVKAVKFIREENDPDGKISAFVQLSQAAALLYLMSCSTSDSAKYDKEGTEKSLDFTMWDMAETFWVDIARNGKTTEHLRESLLSIPEGAGGEYTQALRCGLVIKAWNRHADGLPIDRESIALASAIDPESQRPVLTEKPLLGGIDVGGPPKKSEG